MKGLLLEQPRAFRFVELPEPTPPGPGDALVRVHRVGICGTDISGYLGKMPFFSYPRIPGHELGVEVLSVGKGVTHVQAGDRCSVEPYMNCQTCSACRRGHTNCCENLKVLGVMMDGGLRERFALPARKLHPSRHLTHEQLALVETLAIGCHAVQRGNPARDEAVLVIGAGPIGLAVLEFTRLAGSRNIVLDLNPARLEFCRTSMGVEHTVVAQGTGVDVDGVREAAGGDLPALVIDATGSNTSMSGALQFTAFAGRVVYVGITQQEISFPHAPILHRRELTLLASRNALPPDFTRIIEWIEAGRIDTRPWITHRTPFADLPDAFLAYTRPETGTVKAIVEMP